MFLYCCTWALGGLLDMKDRPPLNKAMVRLAESEAPNFEDPEETFFEYFVSEEDTEWRHWNTQVPAWEYPVAEEKPKFARLIIPTLDSVRLESLLKIVTSVDKQALFVGGPGTAKTTAIKQFMAGFDSDTTATKDITFSSLTQPGTFQVAIESSVEKRSGRTFGPPSGKKMIVFVDDISMPVMNDWGDQVTNEVVRQLLEEGGMYSLEKPIGDMKMIVDCVYLAAMNTPGGGKERYSQPFEEALLHLQRALFRPWRPSTTSSVSSSPDASRRTCSPRTSSPPPRSWFRSPSTSGTGFRPRCSRRPPSSTTCSTCASSARCSRA
jgi:dynein heavy chain